MSTQDLTIDMAIDGLSETDQWDTLFIIFLISENPRALEAGSAILARVSNAPSTKSFTIWLRMCAADLSYFGKSSHDLPTDLGPRHTFLCKVISKYIIFLLISLCLADLQTEEARSHLLELALGLDTLIEEAATGDDVIHSFLLYHRSQIYRAQSQLGPAAECLALSLSLIEENSLEYPQLIGHPYLQTLGNLASIYFQQSRLQDFIEASIKLLERVKIYTSILPIAFAEANSNAMRFLAQSVGRFGQIELSIILNHLALKSYALIPPERREVANILLTHTYADLAQCCSELGDAELFSHFQNLSVSHSGIPMPDEDKREPLRIAVQKFEMASAAAREESTDCPSLFEDAITMLKDATQSTFRSHVSFCDPWIMLTVAYSRYSEYLVSVNDIAKAREQIFSCLGVAIDRSLHFVFADAAYRYAVLAYLEKDHKTASEYFTLAYVRFRRILWEQQLHDLTIMLDSILGSVHCKYIITSPVTRSFLSIQRRTLSLGINAAELKIQATSHSFARFRHEKLIKSLHIGLADTWLRSMDYARSRFSKERCLMLAILSVEASQAFRLFAIMTDHRLKTRHLRFPEESSLSDPTLLENSFDESEFRSRLLLPVEIKPVSVLPDNAFDLELDEALSRLFEYLQTLQTPPPQALMPADLDRFGADEALVYIASLESGLTTFIWTRGVRLALRLNEAASDDLMKELYSWMEASNGFRLTGHTTRSANFNYLPLPLLEKHVIQPILDALPPEIKRVAMCLEPRLTQIPIENHQPLSGNSLATSFRTSRIPSLKIYQHLRPFIPGDRILSITNPQEDLRFSSLEESVLRRHFAGTYLTRKGATKANILSDIENANIIYFSGHAVYDSDRPYRSMLHTADGSGLSILDCLTSITLDKCNLVFLNGCETAQGLGPTPVSQVTTTDYLAIGALIEEQINLAHAFIASGARCVIATLWAVHDISASLVLWKFCQFYSDAANNHDASEALAQAINCLKSIPSGTHLLEKTLPELAASLSGSVSAADLSEIKSRLEKIAAACGTSPPFANPTYWAPYVVIGNPKGS